MEFSPAKTAVILFARNKKPKRLAKLRVYGDEVNFVETAKYLGIIIDSSLTWIPHIKLKLKNAKAHLQIVRAAGTKLKGLQSKQHLWLYESCIVAAVAYGALLWCKQAQSNWGQKEFKRLNRMGLIQLGNFRHSTPGAGLEIIFNVPPLHSTCCWRREL